MKSKQKYFKSSIPKVLSLTHFLLVLALAILYYRSYGNLLFYQRASAEEMDILSTGTASQLFLLFIVVQVLFVSLGTIQNKLCHRHRLDQPVDNLPSSTTNSSSAQPIQALFVNQLPKNHGV